MPEIPWWEGKVGIVKWMKGYGKEDITHGVWSLSRYGRVSVNQPGLFRSPLSHFLGSFLTRVYGSWPFIVRICDTVTQKRSVGTTKFRALSRFRSQFFDGVMTLCAGQHHTYDALGIG